MAVVALRSVAGLVCLAGFAACNGGTQTGEYELVPAFPNLTFTRPVDFQAPPNDSEIVFVVEQRGRIYSFSNESDVADKNLVLDISDRVDDSANEEGLLGLAFHPDYPDSPFVYVNYTADGPDRTVIARFALSGNPTVAYPSSEIAILEVPQPFGNHNGGQVAFGPDRMLYIGFGDGGSGGDPLGHGQNRSTLLGSLLRIDVMDTRGGRSYGIPVDNPFAGNENGFREEIFAYGLRNPWRFSFDRETGSLWTGDVGQNAVEEISVVESGKNYGWNVMEGDRCFKPSSGCEQNGLELPVHAYNHGDDGQSVTGGFVYRGAANPGLRGKYVFGDYVSGRIWALEARPDASPGVSLLVDNGPSVSSFGEDANGELFVCAFEGRIHRLRIRSGESG